MLIIVRKIPVSFVAISLFLFVLLGMVQYAVVIFEGLAHGDVILWTMGMDMISNGGVLKYLKDIFILGFGLYWPYWLSGRLIPKKLAFLIKSYFIFIFSFLCIGFIGYLFDFSPIFFLKAGVRWVLLCHAAFGFFVIAAIGDVKKTDNQFIFNFLVIVLLMDAALVIMQLKMTGFTFGSIIGSSRLSGIFSNAAIAGYFSVSISFIVLIYVQSSVGKKLVLMVLSLFIAICSGTRFAMIIVFLCCCLSFYDYIIRFKGSSLASIISLIVPASILILFTMYSLMVEVSGRGGIIEAQLESGGRIYHLIYYIGLLLEADIAEFFIGRGLGVGTNTGYSLVLSMGLSPDSYRFNWLVDNAALTLFFQVGFLGSIFFWTALFVFIKTVGRNCSSRLYLYWLLITLTFTLSVFTINVFEIYYLIITYMLMYGYIYNKSTQTQI